VSGDLAERVRAVLPASTNIADVWSQQQGEPDPAYDAFRAWLATPQRGAPEPAHMATAAEWNWAERALAYEQAAQFAAAQGAPLVPITAEHVIIKNLMQMVQLETGKLLQQSATNPQAVVGIKDLIATVGLITELQKAGNTAASQATDTSKLTSEQKRTILEARRLLQGLK
jgi:hypothetical protein